ncbi:MAG TPA: glycosyltransferase family 39 protein [Caulobacteraceae bacterium]|nr:glycosyltransferase family 39 protein [Caulobacteraceae bacterium]
MTLKELAAQLASRRRAPLVAACVALLASLPGLLTLPATDRDESRFAEASAQMLESGDFTNIMFQDTPRYKKPVGIYWLQSASVLLLGDGDRRDIWVYRVPSVLGAMLAAWACAWGALAFLAPREAMMAGVLAAATMVLSTESNLATTDAALCGAITLAMAALGKIYLAARGGPPAGRWTQVLLWLGLAASILLKGPIGPMVVALAALAVSVWDRDTRWLARVGWSWGPIILAGVVLPWALAITVATDGGFWGIAVGGDLAPKLFGGQEGHGAPPGYFLLLSPVLLFPAVLLLPAGLIEGWRARAEPGVRFALCWLAPSWLVFELVPTKLPHYVLPTFGALAWLMAAALTRPLDRLERWAGAGLTLAVAAGVAIAGGLGAALFGGGWSWVWEGLAAAALVAGAAIGAVLILRRRSGLAAAGVCALGIVGHGLILGALAPSLKGLLLSDQVADGLARANISPRQGLANGPVAVAGYAEPSLVFALGSATELGSAQDAAEAIQEGRPAVVEARQDSAFRQALAADGAAAQSAGAVSGLNYSSGHPQLLRLYQPVPARSGPAS